MKHPSHNPSRDWYLVLGITSLLAVSVFAWAYWFHSTVSQPDPIEGNVGTVSTSDVLDGKVLDKTNRQFLERASEFDRVRYSAPVSVDPAE
ncbi:MAG: hypothetical protein AAB391_03370 [Patescibacteria group bacterium]